MRGGMEAMRAVLSQRYHVEGVVVESEAMRRVYDLALRAAPTTATALIWGESGTGKEKIARFVHYHSERAAAPFVAVNCRALAEGVIDSELFGHAQGAFTGASRDRAGIFEQAHGGTLLLDEIGEASEELQAKLLRVLQEREVVPVGSSRRREVDVRVLAATNRDLTEEVREGRFREDLYFRLNVIPLYAPPLRERREEVLPLARHFVALHADRLGRVIEGWSGEVEAHLMAHAWPGNVRELENMIERACVLARTPRLELGDLLVREGLGGVSRREARTLDEVVDEAIEHAVRGALARAGGHRQRAAKALGVERTTLYRHMQRLGIEV